ncbi:TIGR02530 family flagellar biosynthesis protein [Cohnella sp. REN36]|uniref:TIGR02530 family flagellar biosynthesis protein n=1 Tax=Cohnella sp. REN36 TaxID=2887347 RepID=UPI001D13D6EA|nr:TIGR02530 family flagellar biosynthesis protein [Cohnella sp. REN36]MCC3376233.1 flagellar biosynthesis protein [Cohnella sp. REN36]
MSDRFLVGQLGTGRAAPLRQSRQPTIAETGGGSGDDTFRKLLSREQLRFSLHAEQRLTQRGIAFAPEQLDRIAGAIDQAAAKGARDSLVLFRDIAMIVNVPSRTVVTAMDGQDASQVFTQIDSAVIVR